MPTQRRTLTFIDTVFMLHW